MVSALRMFAGLTAMFVLTVLVVYYDPVMEDSIYGDLEKQVDDGTRPQEIMDYYLDGWQIWPIMFIAAILIYTLTSGRSKDFPSRTTYL